MRTRNILPLPNLPQGEVVAPWHVAQWLHFMPETFLVTS